MTALTCSAYRDSELVKELEAKYPVVKESIERPEELLCKCIKRFLEENKESVELLHDHSKLAAENRALLWLLYDMLAVDTLEQHWPEHKPRQIDNYYKLRQHVRDSTLIHRVQVGIKALT
jgi:hypothetical protein